MNRRTYTVTEAAQILGISRSSAYEAVRRGEIPSITIGHRIVVSRHDRRTARRRSNVTPRRRHERRLNR